MKIGIVLHKILNSNIFIVDVGWGQLRYFLSNKLFEEGDILLYKEKSYFDEEEDDRYYESREAWLKDEESPKSPSDSNRIEAICRFEDCEFLGDKGFEYHEMGLSKYDIVIARKKFYVYWKGYGQNYIRYIDAKNFDMVSNSLLFSLYAEPKYPLPDEKEWLKAYIYAKKKVEELDIPKMIEELKVEVHNNDWTRRGSDNILFCHSSVLYNYEYNYSYLHDDYLDAIFPKYAESLYSSKDGECEYINPKYEKFEIIRMADGSNKIKAAKFEGVDIDEFCAKKTIELRQVALKNYESYNKDEHVIHIAYNYLGWNQINFEYTMFKKLEALYEIIWKFNHHKLLEQITKDNYQRLIQNNNSNHPIPNLPDNVIN